MTVPRVSSYYGHTTYINNIIYVYFLTIQQINIIHTGIDIGFTGGKPLYSLFQAHPLEHSLSNRELKHRLAPTACNI